MSAASSIALGRIGHCARGVIVCALLGLNASGSARAGPTVPMRGGVKTAGANGSDPIEPGGVDLGNADARAGRGEGSEAGQPSAATLPGGIDAYGPGVPGSVRMVFSGGTTGLDTGLDRALASSVMWGHVLQLSASDLMTRRADSLRERVSPSIVNPSLPERRSPLDAPAFSFDLAELSEVEIIAYSVLLMALLLFALVLLQSLTGSKRLMRFFERILGVSDESAAPLPQVMRSSNYTAWRRRIPRR